MSLGKHVVHFALQPTPEAAALALALADEARRRHRLTARPVPAARLHVSLNAIGAFKRPPPAQVFEKAAEAVGGVVAAPFTVAFNRLGSWGRGDPRPVVLWADDGAIGANALFSTLHKALNRFDMVPRREPPAEPHMILLHDAAEVPQTVVPPVSWQVSEFVLVHAVHGEGRYDIVGRFPLSG